MQSLPHQGQFHMVNPNHQSMGHGQYSQDGQCGSEIGHTQGPSSMSQQMACLQPLGHLGGRLHVLVNFFNSCFYLLNWFLVTM